MKIFISSLITFLLGAFVSFLVVSSFSVDEVGRKDQLLFTLMRIISENEIVIKKQQVNAVVENLYPTEDISKEEGSIKVQKMEFIFDDNKLKKVKTY